MEIPKTRYARSADGAYIAYQVVGDGPVDLLWISPWFSDLELAWEYPPIPRFYRELNSFARLILMDQRGIGLSDKTRGHADLEGRMDDLRAVLDATSSESTILWGAGPDGGALCAMYAATYPERVLALAFWNGQARAQPAPDYPWNAGSFLGLDAESESELFMAGWGDEDHTAEMMLSLGAPSVAADPAAVRWAAQVCRRMGAPGDIRAFEDWYNEIDFRAVLPLVYVPTLAVFRAFPGDPDGSAPYRDLAARIPGAKSVELPPNEFPPWGADMERAVAAVREFAKAITSERAVFSRVLSTVLFTDIVGSTATGAELGDAAWREVLERHHAIVRSMLARYRGQEVDTAGDGFFATFDGPARAVRCAVSIVDSVRSLGLEVRAGVHTGEVETIAGKAGGMAVVIGARIGALAGPSEVLTSQTVKDLTVGSGIDYADSGEHELKGVPDRWHLYRVVA